MGLQNGYTANIKAKTCFVLEGNLVKHCLQNIIGECVRSVRWTFSHERSKKHENVIMGVNVTIYFLID